MQKKKEKHETFTRSQYTFSGFPVRLTGFNTLI